MRDRVARLSERNAVRMFIAVSITWLLMVVTLIIGLEQPIYIMEFIVATL